MCTRCRHRGPNAEFSRSKPMKKAIQWTEERNLDLAGLKIGFSAPKLVGRSREYFWFPSLANCGKGRLLAQIQNHPDMQVRRYDRLGAWSVDGGLRWSEPFSIQDGGFANLRRSNGDTILLPYVVLWKDGGLGAPYNVIPKGKLEVIHTDEEITITGWPRPLPPKRHWVINNQPALPTTDGKHLITLHGYFEGAKRASLVAADSEDGINWQIRSTIADENCRLFGNDGPSEACLCRLRDGRLMCVFRLSGWVPFGQTWSADEGRTWSTPVSMARQIPSIAFSVQPALAVLENGSVVLAGGRPGLYLWFDRLGTGEHWERVDALPHHNASCPDEPIELYYGFLYV